MSFAVLLASALATAPGSTELEVFHGWSKDASWLVYETHGANELVELFFCATSADVKPSWPAGLNEVDREDVQGLSCVHYLDPNKAPWQWKAQLSLPAASNKAAGLEVLHELALDGDEPGFVVEAGEHKQGCYVSGVRERSRLGKVWIHPTGRFVAAMVDGVFHHCVVTLKAPPAAKPPRKR